MTSDNIIDAAHAARHQSARCTTKRRSPTARQDRLGLRNGLGGHARGEEESAAAMEVLVRASATELVQALETLVRGRRHSGDCVGIGRRSRHDKHPHGLLLTAGSSPSCMRRRTLPYCCAEASCHD